MNNDSALMHAAFAAALPMDHLDAAVTHVTATLGRVDRDAHEAVSFGPLIGATVRERSGRRGHGDS